MTTDIVPADPSTPPQPTEAAMVTAYQSVLPEMMALPKEALVPVNLDVTAAAGVAFGVAHRIPKYRAEVEQRLSAVIHLQAFDKLGTYALGLMQANALFRAASRPVNGLRSLAARGARLRQQMMLDATCLAFKGLIDGSSLDDLKGPNGYHNLAVDLTTLSALLRQNWSTIQHKCASDLGDLVEASEIGARIVDAKGIRDLEPAGRTEAAEMRQRAFTLLMHAYDQVRRAVTCLRWNEGDADGIAPSLFAGRSNGRGKEQPEPEPTVPAATATPVPAASAAAPADASPPGASPFVA